MKRLAIFAFYNEKCLINDYVVTYLKYLKEVSDNIIFVADNEPNVKELSKIYPLVSHIESYHHGEYDFGSYKIGFKYAKEHYLLDDVDEIIFDLAMNTKSEVVQKIGRVFVLYRKAKEPKIILP